jgi:hypothetical protein
MLTQSRDTNVEAEKILIALLRETSFEKKMKQVFSFSSSILRLAKRGISKANPDLNEQEKNVLFVRVHYGNELAEKFKAFINKENNGK